jgi:hypothetical protein
MRLDANPLLQRRQQQAAREFYRTANGDGDDVDHMRPNNPRIAGNDDEDDEKKEENALLQRRNTQKNMAVRPEVEKMERQLGRD